VLVDKYAQKTALRLGVSPDAVRAEFRKGRAKPAAPEPEERSDTVEPTQPPPSVPEYWLLKLLLLNDDLVEWAAAHLDPQWIQHPQVKEIISRRLAAFHQRTWTSLPAFLSEFTTQADRNLITEATTEERPLPDPARQLQDVGLRLRGQFIDSQMARLMHRASQPETGDAEKLELLRQRESLRALKKRPLGSSLNT
jgi:hypothetical protein